MIYFAQEQINFLIKIGYTGKADVSDRVGEWATGSPGEVVLILTHPGERHDEDALHLRFASLRVRPNAEWFRPGPDLLRYLMECGRATGSQEGYRTGRIAGWNACHLENIQQQEQQKKEEADFPNYVGQIRQAVEELAENELAPNSSCYEHYRYMACLALKEIVEPYCEDYLDGPPPAGLFSEVT